jgi:multiple sugar transport system substrate-binding protein
MNKKVVILGTMIALFFSLLVGCGGNSTTNGSDTTSTDNVKNDTSSNTTTKKVALDFWTNIDTAEITANADEWNKTHPDVQVKVTSITGGSAEDYFQKLSTAFAAGVAPDMFTMSSTEWLKYVKSGIAYSVDEWVAKNKSDYQPSIYESNIYEGKAYSFPQNTDLMGLYYDKKLFQKEGLQPPKTWDELIQIAKKLTTKERFGLAISTDQSGYQDYEWYPFLWMSGGNIVSSDGTKVLVDDGTKNALQLYRDLINSGAVAKKLEIGAWDISGLAQGKAAMQLSGQWAVKDLRTKYPDFEFGVVPYPVPKEGMKSSSDAGGWRYMVSSKGKDPKAAAEALNWMMNSDPARALPEVKNNFRITPRKSVIDAAGDFYKTSPMDIFINDILPVAQSEPTYSAGVVKAIGEALQQAMFTDTPIDKIVEELKKKSETAIKNNQ